MRRASSSATARAGVVLAVVTVVVATVLTFVPGPARAVAPWGWSTTGELTNGRYNQSLVRLDGTPCRATAPAWCGNVLLVGGSADPDAPGELYVVATGEWEPTGPLLRKRRGAGDTATLLPDGRVLVVGGKSPGDGPVAEVYDPNVTSIVVDGRSREVRGAWRAAAPPLRPRSGHSATLLPDGTVLVAGGATTSGGTSAVLNSATAEIFDPAGQGPDPGVVGAWRDAPRMSFGRIGHTATLLPATSLAGAQVLVTGGSATVDAQVSELYDLASQAWLPTAPGGARVGATATLLRDGTVLVVGGSDNSPQAAAGSVSSGIVGLGERAAEVYEPATLESPARWRSAGTMTVPRAGHTATLLGGSECSAAPLPLHCGQVLVTGGEGSAFNAQASLKAAEVYDPSAGAGTDASGQPVKGRWVATGAMVAGRALHAAVLLADGRVLVAGGKAQDPDSPYFQTDPPPLRSAEVFEPSPTPPARPSVLRLSTPRGPSRGGTSVVVTGAGFGTGSEVYFGDEPAQYVRIESSSRIVATSPPRAEPGTVPVVVRNGDRSSRSTPSSRFTYFASAGVWNATAAMSAERVFHTATLLTGPACALPDPPRYCGKVLVAGGRDAGNVALASAEIYDPRTSTWVPAPTMGTARAGHTATLLPSGEVLVVGGTSDGVSPVASVETYDPAQGTWRPTSSLNVARMEHTATLVDGVGVFVMGGCDTAVGYYRARPCRGHLLESAELLRPGGGWARTDLPPLPAGHTFGYEAAAPQVVTALPGGQALVSGGIMNNLDNSVKRPVAYVHDTAAGTWTETASPVDQRMMHAAIPVGTKVLLVGGQHPDLNTDFREVPAATVTRFDPGDGTWTEQGSLLEARTLPSVVLLPGGDVLVAGGCTRFSGTKQCHSYTGSSELYDPATGTSRPTESLLEARAGHTATPLPDGTVLVAGGYSHAEVFSSAERFDPAATAPRTAVVSLGTSGGTTSGGTQVRVVGAGFLYGEAAVAFGTTPAKELIVRSDRELVAVTPPHRPGAFPLTVTTSRGSSSMPFAFGPGAWSATAAFDSCPEPSCVPRYSHTATLLADGRVLVAGGYSQVPGCSLERGLVEDLTARIQPPKECETAQPTSSAMVYDPASGQWAPTGSMASPRAAHTAVLLEGGRVLVAGGGADASAETYDPQAGVWSRAGSLATNRTSHTATLLADGRVLVTGGWRNDGIVVAAAEIYDPGTATWSGAGQLAEPRMAHTSTRLRDGSVLVVGGCARGGHLCEEFPPASERYVPVAGGPGTWSAGPPPAVPRSHATATLLDSGKVLLAGGCTHFELFVFVKRCDSYPRTVELFDPAAGNSGRWEPTGSLREGRAGHTATALADGRVLLAGSGWLEADPLASAALYDPASGGWSFTSFLGEARDSHTATLLHDGRVLVAGGAGPGGLRSSMSDSSANDESWPLAVSSAEIYTFGPQVSTLFPASGPTGGGTPVRLVGKNLAGATAVSFGSVQAASIGDGSPTEITALSPTHPGATVEVVLTTPGGSSLSATPVDYRFTFVPTGVPGRVGDLSAESLSDSTIRLTFTTAGTDGYLGPPSTRYVVKESTGPIIDEAAFEAAPALCEGTCVFPTASLGYPISLNVGGRAPGTTYHYALRALTDDGRPGPVSNSSSATTAGTAAQAAADGQLCPLVPAAGPGQVGFPSGYSMVGVPDGTTLAADSPLFGWSDMGSGGSYSVRPAGAPVPGGQAHWAWFSCPRLVMLSGAGTDSARLPLRAYHASMVGNPSGTGPVRAAGFDFAARWDPELNGGSGGYHVSGRREAQTLAVGEGLWVFTYRDTTVEISR